MKNEKSIMNTGRQQQVHERFQIVWVGSLGHTNPDAEQYVEKIT